MDELIGGEDGHGRVGVTRGDESDPESDGGGGVAFRRFGEDVSGWEHVGHFADFLFLEGVCEDEDVFGGNEALEAGDGLIEEGGVVEEVEQLLRFGVAAERPETGSASSGENKGIVVAHRRH